MKKVSVILLIFICLFGVGVYWWTPAAIETKLATTLKASGLTNPQLHGVSYDLSSISIKKITDDTYHNGTSITDIRLDISWPQFLTAGDINHLYIGQYTTEQSFKHLYSRLYNGTWDIPLPDINRVTIASLSISLPLPDLNIQNKEHFNITGEIALKKEEEERYIIDAQLNSTNEKINFHSRWEGEIQQRKLSYASGVFDTINLDIFPLILHRGTSWASIHQQNDGKYGWSGQLEAGSGKFIHLPLNKINLAGKSEDNHGSDMTFSAAASGYPDIALNINATIPPNGQNETQQQFAFSILAPNADDTSQYLQNSFPSQRNNAALLSENFAKNTPDALFIHYLPEKKFSGGPLPFDMTGQKNGKDLLNSTFLVYPEGLELRGNISAPEEVLNMIAQLFNISPSDITGENLKLDQKLSDFIP